MDRNTEDRGSQNPRQAEVDRIRDAAFASAASQRSSQARNGGDPSRDETARTETQRGGGDPESRD